MARDQTKMKRAIAEGKATTEWLGSWVEVGCPQDPKKKGKKKWATPDRSTSCWLLLLLLPPVHTGTPVLGQQGPTVHAASPH